MLFYTDLSDSMVPYHTYASVLATPDGKLAICVVGAGIQLLSL